MNAECLTRPTFKDGPKDNMVADYSLWLDHKVTRHVLPVEMSDFGSCLLSLNGLLAAKNIGSALIKHFESGDHSSILKLEIAIC